MKVKISLDKFRIAGLWLFCILITLFSVLRNTLSNDGRIYFLAGKSINDGSSPWNSKLDPFAQYLYGPINALLNSILARSSYEIFILAIKLGTCLLLLYVIKKVTLNISSALPVYFLCCCTFSFRSNMQYAAIGGLGSLLLILSLQAEPRVAKRWGSTATMLLLDFKPHIYWFSILLSQSKKKLFGLVSLASITYLVIYLSSSDLSVENWIRTILERKNGLASDPTIISPIFVLFHNTLPMYVLMGINILTVAIVVILCKKSAASLEFTALATYASALITTPYLHTIDTLGLTLLVLAGILRMEKISSAHLLLIIANCLWSTSVFYSVITTTLIILILCISKKLPDLRYPILIGACSVLIFIVFSKVIGVNEIPSWYYTLILALNINAIFRLRSVEVA